MEIVSNEMRKGSGERMEASCFKQPFLEIKRGRETKRLGEGDVTFSKRESKG